MNKLILENALKDLDLAKHKLIPRILHDFTRYVDFLIDYKEIYDPDGSILKKLEKYFTFEEREDKLYYKFEHIDHNSFKTFVDDVLISLPLEMVKTRKKFSKYRNKFGYFHNQEEKIKHQIEIWKIEAQHILDNIVYKDLSILIMTYL